MAPSQPDHGSVLVHRQVTISCPSGKHTRSIVTLRNHVVAVMFCLPCEQAWTEPTPHPEIRAMAVDRQMQG